MVHNASFLREWKLSIYLEQTSKVWVVKKIFSDDEIQFPSGFVSDSLRKISRKIKDIWHYLYCFACAHFFTYKKNYYQQVSLSYWNRLRDWMDYLIASLGSSQYVSYLLLAHTLAFKLHWIVYKLASDFF